VQAMSEKGLVADFTKIVAKFLAIGVFIGFVVGAVFGKFIL